MSDTLLFLLISGSIREHSFTRELTLQLQKCLGGYRVTCDHWDPRRRPLPVCDPAYHEAPADNPAPGTHELAEIAYRADGFVFATPVYHNSYSGLLKNIIDHLTIAQVRYKPVLLLSHGGHRATHAVDHLRIVARGLLGISLPSHVCTARTDYEESAAGVRLVSPEILARLARAAAEAVAFARMLRTLRQASGK